MGIIREVVKFMNRDRADRPKGPAPLPRFESEKVFGRNACRAVWKNRPQDIMRAAVATDARTAFGDCLRDLASRKIAYSIVDEEELSRIAGSEHHEGVCFLVRAKKTLGDDAVATMAQMQGPILCLDKVGNPHNFGAVVRSCAHFGVPAILGDQTLPSLSGAGGRVAEGGSEHVSLVKVSNLEKTIRELKSKGLTVYAVDNKGGQPIYKTDLDSKAVFILGAEGPGLSAILRKVADEIVTIPGTGLVESLNVSVAAALILGEYWRQHERSEQKATPENKKRIPSTQRPHRKLRR